MDECTDEKKKKYRTKKNTWRNTSRCLLSDLPEKQRESKKKKKKKN